MVFKLLLPIVVSIKEIQLHITFIQNQISAGLEKCINIT